MKGNLDTLYQKEISCQEEKFFPEKIFFEISPLADFRLKHS